jgi:hypothetical protein
MLGVAAKLVERLGRKIAKVRMLAQDRQFDAPRLGRDIRQFACPVTAHEQRIGRSLACHPNESIAAGFGHLRHGRTVVMKAMRWTFAGCCAHAANGHAAEQHGYECSPPDAM